METDASGAFNLKLLLCSTRRWLRHEFFSHSNSFQFISTAYWIVYYILLCRWIMAHEPERDRWDCIIKTVFIFRSKLIKWTINLFGISSAIPLCLSSFFCFVLPLMLNVQLPQAHANGGRTLHVAGITRTSLLLSFLFSHRVFHFFGRQTEDPQNLAHSSPSYTLECDLC